MESVNLVNENNELMNARVVRYFELNNKNYLIYSLNEVDEQNYVILYAVKVANENGLLVSSPIDDENDWMVIKELIKVIVRGNKDGIADVADLDYKKLEALSVKESRIFKISNQLVELLAANKKTFEEPEVNLEPFTIGQVQAPEVNLEPEIAPAPVVEQEKEEPQPNAEVDYYKNLYEQEKAKNEELNNKLNEIKKLLG